MNRHEYATWYFPCVLICSLNQNNVRWITTFFIFFITTLPTILARHQIEDIFNADKFGLFYELLPQKSMHFRAKYRGCSCSLYTQLLASCYIWLAYITFSRRVTVRWWRQSAKSQCRPIRTREIRDVSLSDVLYGGQVENTIKCG